MEREAAQEQAKSESEAQSWYYQAFAMAYFGHLQQARMMSTRATDMAQQAGQPERAAVWGTGAALLEAFFADPSTARKKAKAALDAFPGSGGGVRCGPRLRHDRRYVPDASPRQ